MGKLIVRRFAALGVFFGLVWLIGSGSAEWTSKLMGGGLLTLGVAMLAATIDGSEA